MNYDNQYNPVPPIVPPPVPKSELALGDNPNERVPITGVITAFEALLREPRRVFFQFSQKKTGMLIVGLVLITIVCSLIYGVVTGTFSGGMQLWAAPSKISIGLLICGIICLPSLYIFSCLSGSQARLVEVLGLVAGLLALMTILLIGFAPVAWVFSQSTESVVAMGALHWVFAAIALYFGMRFLKQGCVLLNAHATGYLKVWMIIFTLVILQMATALRPIIGTAPTTLPTEKKFFLSHWVDSFTKDARSQR